MTEIQLLKLSNYLQWFGSFAIAVLAFYRFKLNPREIKLIGMYGLASVVFQLLQTGSGYLFENFYINIIGDTYVLVEGLLLLALYYQLFNSRPLKAVLFTAGLICLGLYALVLVDPTYPWYSVLSTVHDFLMIACAVAFFYNLIVELPQENLLRVPMFWINSGILFFFSCTFMLSLSQNYIVDVLQNNLAGYWAFRNFLRLLFCLVICMGVWQGIRAYYRQRKSLSKSSNLI